MWWFLRCRKNVERVTNDDVRPEMNSRVLLTEFHYTMC
jgi:hypothetical protein